MGRTVSLLVLTVALGCGDGGLGTVTPPDGGGDTGSSDASVDARGSDGGGDAGGADGGDDASPGDASTDAPVADAGAPDAAPPVDAGTDACPAGGCAVELLRRDGCFEIVAAGDVEEHAFGAVGTEYDALVVEYDLHVGDWRRDRFDATTPLNHITFGLSRNAPNAWERYLLGMAPQVTPSVASLDRKTVFFARVDLDPRPAGMGYTSYTTFRQGFAWQTETDYHVTVTLDAAGARQVLEVARAGAVVQTVTGDIAYMSPALTRSGFRLTLGAPDGDGRDVSPVGWRICDTRVRGVLRE